MLIFSDGFDTYSQTNGSDLTKKWSSKDSAMGWNATAGVNGGGCLASNNLSSAPWAVKSFDVATSATRLNFSFWFKSGGTSSPYTILSFLKNELWTFDIRITSGGNLNFYNPYFNVDVPSTKIDDGGWHHVEMSIFLTTSTIADNIKIWLDGVLKYTSNIQTVSGADRLAPNKMAVYMPYSYSYCYIDDLIIWDDQTSDGFSTSPIGVRSIYTLRPSAAGSQTDLTPFGASVNADCVKGAYDSDTTLVYGSAGTDLYDYSDLPITPTSIAGVSINSVIRADTSGSFALVNKVKSGSASGSSASKTIAGTTYQTYQTMHQKDPNTNAAWTASGLASAEFGIQVG